jgi:hypothetical protein
MINYSQSTLHGVVAHMIGNHNSGEDIKYSSSPLHIEDQELEKCLFNYFFNHFKDPEFYRFSFPTGEIELNPIYNFAANIFDDPSCLHEQSVKIARHLYEKSKHPNIKSGELYVAYFSDILIDDEMTDALVIFKSENKENFLQLRDGNEGFNLLLDNGIPTDKLDKGCIIFNTDRDEGFKICNIDHSNRYKEAQFWREEFLMITPAKDDYHMTKNYIQVTKNFIRERMPVEFDADKADEAAAMSRSFEYFKHNEKFDALEYEKKVFKDDKVVDAFKDYKEEFQNLKNATLFDEFDISDYAVKKQSRVFKSVIKLDKNFHIYVHGDKNKILKGQDDDGRKYYILYYENEN